MTSEPSKKNSRLPVYVVLAILLVVTAAFIAIFISATQSELQLQGEATAELTEDPYAERVAALLEGADASRGALLVEQYGCTACHREGAVNKIAPPFTGIADIAGSRRPPLSAASYIYESTLHPTAFVVEGFLPVMAVDYPERLSDQDLGDLIAYLLTPDAH